jgi:kynureninase
MSATIDTSVDFAHQLDERDPLHHFRQRFEIADDGLIYMDGNSLGRLPQDAVALSEKLVKQQWGERLIRSWNEGWWDASERIGAKIASLIGAQPDEVIIADSTSVNLFKLATAALRMQSGRSRILTDDLNFPSDVYILQGIIDLLDGRHQINIVNSPNGIHTPDDALSSAIDRDTALVTVSHTAFKSGAVYDMSRVTQAAHEQGALILWDLSHSVGALPVNLNAAGADLAIGCTYKYLNGGPGAPAFLYIRRDLQDRLLNPISGWFGQRDPFAFGLNYQPVQGIRRFLTGTPPIISLSLIEPGVDLLLEAGMDALHQKSLQQTDYLIELWETLLQPLGYILYTPREQSRRGSHVSLGHEHGLAIDLALIDRYHVLPDFRAPNIVRLGITPLYTTYHEIWQTVMALREIAERGTFEAFRETAPTVT